jgi:hypothetical protein
MSASRAALGAIVASGLALGLTAGCGTSSVGACASSADCPSGSVCGADGECVANAPLPPPPPDAGTTPEPNGGGCPSKTLELSRIVPSVQFLLDQSGTMKNKMGNIERFSAMRNALIDAKVGVVAALQSQVSFGITLYTSHNGGATCPILQTVERSVGNLASISDVLTPALPDSDNPLAETIDRAVADFAASPPAGGPGVIIVATDGNADTCTNSDDGSGKGPSVEAATRAHDAHLELYMVSIANGVDSDYLQQMANAGIGRAIQDVSGAPFFTASDQAAMVSSFQRILRQVRCRVDSRDLTIDLIAGSAVRLGARALTRGADWEVVDDRTLGILGSACDALLADPAATVSVTPPCL